MACLVLRQMGASGLAVAGGFFLVAAAAFRSFRRTEGNYGVAPKDLRITEVLSWVFLVVGVLLLLAGAALTLWRTLA